MDVLTYALAASIIGATWYTTGYKACAAGPTATGEKLFQANCAGCHAAGGNLIDPTKPLKGSKKLVSKELFKSAILNPTGSMAPFPQIAENDADLTVLYNYCKSLK